MNKTKTKLPTQKITVDMIGLQEMLSVGRGACEQIALEAGALIRVGKRKLYNVRKIQEYIDNYQA